MSYKTFFEQFATLDSKSLETTSPFDFQDDIKSGEASSVVLVAPAAEPQGTTLQMPQIPSTHTIEVVEEPETFRGELPHLAPEEHEAVIQWFDKASLDESVPTEVRLFLVELAVKLKLDAKKRIVPSDKKSEE